ncbi:hypothetical protein RJ639_018645 [Escallonia herrerae]|uniref:Chromo domain-containing protein n=1 Tax=Escallonia herrerae TaxID=1293975 RepID=A0AA88V876_9ASTE|nr:hypothetical protein RJ639_018645 [Escallonia herrerae]
MLKRELKSQFFPENTAFNVRKVLLECKHTGLVRVYCQAFSALMLDISDMSTVDRLFFFMEGLKPWARTELNRRRVNNLNDAIIAAESLSDYNSEPQRPPQRGNPSRSIGGKKPGGQAPNQSWGMRTDNTAVSHFLSQSKLSSKQARWQELLAEFNFMLEYRAGSTNSVADALSRRAELDQVALMAMNAIVRADNRVAINIEKKIRKALTRDPIAQQLLKLIESESDGQTERFNSMLEEYLRHFVSATQKNWVKLLDVAQLCFNSRKISSTGKSAFEINIDLAHSYLEKAARRMKKHADKNRRSQEFNVGEKVMVKLLPQDLKFLRGRDSRLLQKYEGPLTIVKKISKMAYKVDPPHWWSHQLHPVFHVSMLKPFYEDIADPSRGQIRRQGLKPKAAGKRVAKAILNDRVIIASRKRHQEYLVKWQGHMDEENTWE